MNIIQLLFLSLIQGIAEFLPISSSGHLNLAQFAFNLKPSLAFDIFINTATLISVFFFFRKKIKFFLNNIFYIFIGSIPAALVGVLLKDQFENIFGDIKLLPFFFLITSILVFSTKFIKPQDQKLNAAKSLIIGLIQAFAILPGVSRAGSTIFAALLVGLSPVNAFNFAFSLYIPASLGAILLSIKDLSGNGFLSLNFILSFIFTVVVGIISLNLLKSSLQSRKYYLFSVYTATISLVSFLYLYL